MTMAAIVAESVARKGSLGEEIHAGSAEGLIGLVRDSMAASICFTVCFSRRSCHQKHCTDASDVARDKTSCVRKAKAFPTGLAVSCAVNEKPRELKMTESRGFAEMNLKKKW